MSLSLLALASLPDNIVKIIRRADAHCWYDALTNTWHIRSYNTEAPMTDEEKERIKNYYAIHLFTWQFVFD